MLYDQRSILSGYVSGLLSRRQSAFTAEEAEGKLGIGHSAFLDAAERLQRRKVLLSPRQGFYVAVPSEFESWGAPPAEWYIDALMRFEGHAYYVGLLKAAEMHGAAHQAVMTFQVISTKRLPRIYAGRSRIVTYFRKNMEEVASGIGSIRTETGTMKVSSPELTALDLLRYPQGAGGIDNVATVLIELSEVINADRLAELSVIMERPVVQRLGHLLDRFGHQALTGPMLRALRKRGSMPWSELDRRRIRHPEFTPEPQEHDATWRIIVRRVPEPDV